ncbi:hypothetical protein BGX27_007662 [Mortierella sp. AM989]|nr:hypothetical protein BGX27_007662 [Mortierella sp. AM989]
MIASTDIDDDYALPRSMFAHGDGSLSIITTHATSSDMKHQTRDLITLQPITPSKSVIQCTRLRQFQNDLYCIMETSLERYSIALQPYPSESQEHPEPLFGLNQRKATFQPEGEVWRYCIRTRFGTTNSEGNKFGKAIECTLTKEDIRGRTLTLILEWAPEPWINFTKRPDLDEQHQLAVAFLPCGTRFVVWGAQVVQVWNLPGADTPLAIQAVIVQQTLNLTTATYYRLAPRPLYDNFCSIEDIKYVKKRSHIEVHYKDSSVTATIPLPAFGAFDSSLTKHYAESISTIVSMHNNSNSAVQKCIVDYIRQCIVHDTSECGENESIIHHTLMCCKHDGFKPFLEQLFADDPRFTSWVPRFKSRFESWESEITFLLDVSSLDNAMVLINYCIRQSKVHHPLFVEPVIACLPELIKLHPEAALQVFHRMAFTPISKNMAQFVRRNRVLGCDYSSARLLNMYYPRAILKITRRYINSRIAKTFLPDILSEADILSFYKQECLYIFASGENPYPRLQSRLVLTPHRVPQEEEIDNLDGQLFLASVSIMSGVGGTSRTFALEYFENKSLAVVIEFYWNDLVGRRWPRYFFYKLIIFGVILKTTFMQIFDPESPISMVYIYHIVIVFFSIVTLMSELRQALRGIREYLS